MQVIFYGLDQGQDPYNFSTEPYPDPTFGFERLRSAQYKYLSEPGSKTQDP